MPANKEQLDRVLTAFKAYTQQGKAKVRTEAERLAHEQELARAKREAAKPRAGVAP